MTKLLVIDCYDEPGRILLKKSGATQAGILYKRMLSNFIDEEHIDIAHISHEQYAPIDISKYAGVCWTGSNLFFSNSNKIVERHITLCRQLFEAGVPQFGSCWAAQLAAISAGGTVEANPKGREFGLARKILLTDAGHNHPMFRGKPKVFDGFTSHSDIITEMPHGGTLLAGNAFSPVQALEVKHAQGVFWAVQYHPEYNTAEIASLSQCRTDQLIFEGKFKDKDAADLYRHEFRTLEQDPSRSDLLWKYGIDEDVQNFATRTCEVKNWFSYFFAPLAA